MGKLKVLNLFAAAIAALASAGCAPQGAWRDSFPVARASLGPAGRSPYFVLEPGYRLHYQEGQDTLVITVLRETRKVDGVETAVVEEREEEAGALKEVSRNFLAIDRETGDVYYFGEDVDIYRDGRVVGHGGAWLSGLKGARFGLLMPGRARVGDRHYQELAPGTAMDRAEVLSVNETVTVPAGTFRNCVHVKETSPLESGASHKWYAPGVGLIKDGGMELVKVTPAGG